MPTRKPEPDRDWILDEGCFAYVKQPKTVDPLSDRTEENEGELFEHFERLAAVFAKHFDRPEETDDLKLADFFFKRRCRCLEEFWSKRDVLDDLAALRQSLNTISAVLDRLPIAVSDELRRAAIEPVLGQVEDLGWGAEMSADTYLSVLPSWQAFQTLIAFQKHIKGIVKLVDAASDVAATGVPVGNKGLEAWRTVETCAELCALSPGTINVPNRMNNAGPFYRLLLDVFEVMGHDEDPVSAFRGWRRHVGRAGENRS